MVQQLGMTVIFCAAVGLIAGCAQDADPAAAPNTQPLADRPDYREDRDPVEAFTGTLEGGIMAIGGETTGWRLIGDGEAGALMVDVSTVSDQADKLNGRRVTIRGTVTTRDYVERGKVAVLVAREIQPAE